MKYIKQDSGYYQCKTFDIDNFGIICKGRLKPKVVLFNNNNRLNFLNLSYDTMNKAKNITSDILKGKEANEAVKSEFLYK